MVDGFGEIVSWILLAAIVLWFIGTMVFVLIDMSTGYELGDAIKRWIRRKSGGNGD